MRTPNFVEWRPLDQKNVSFGAGIHFCIGAPLARLEMQVALKVLFEHPSDSSLDVTVSLAPTPTGWRAEAAVPAGHHWNLSAADAAGTWRLKGRMDKAGHAARLAPALRTEP